MFLLLDPGDDSQLTLTADPIGLSFAGRSEIGVYRHRIPSADVQALRDLLLEAARDAPRS